MFVLEDRLRHLGAGRGRGVVGRAGLKQINDLAAAFARSGHDRLQLVGREILT